MADWVVNRDIVDLPVGRYREWDADAAKEAWRKVISDKPTREWGAKEWKRFGEMFLVYREGGNRLEDFKLPVAEPDEQGRLRLNPFGVRAAYAALRGARGGVDIPEDVRQRALDVVDRLREKVGWKDEREELRKLLREFLIEELRKALSD